MHASQRQLPALSLTCALACMMRAQASDTAGADAAVTSSEEARKQAEIIGRPTLGSNQRWYSILL